MATTTTTISSAYGTMTSTTTTTTVVPNIYNDKGCGGGTPSCGEYSAYVKCMQDLYAGVGACQEIYILDSDGQPVDIDRIDRIDMTLSNEFECVVMSTGNAISIESLQTSYDGPLFELNPDNFWDNEDKYFETHNVRVADNDPELICPDDEKAIIFGKEEDGDVFHGHIIFNPFTYTGALYLKIMSNENNEGSCICMLNGLPQIVTLNAKNSIINILDNCDASVLNIMSLNSLYRPSVLKVNSITVSCTKGVTNKGLVRICYDGSKIPEIAGRLTAEIMLKFNDSDVEAGATKIIKCVPMANVKKSTMITKNNGCGCSCKCECDENEYNVGGIVYKYVSQLPTASWNTMNAIYLVDNPNATKEKQYLEYITVKRNVNGVWAYTWERMGDVNYDINVEQKSKHSVAINLTDNEDDKDTIVLKHKDRKNGKGSMIAFDKDGDSTIVAKVTHIDGGRL